MDNISNNIDEILHALDIPLDSDDDNCDNFLSDDKLLEDLEDLDFFNQENTIIEINDQVDVHETPNIINLNKGSQNVNTEKPQKRCKSPVKVYTNVRWKKGNLIMDEEFLKFSGNTYLPREIINLETPLEFFKYFFDD